VTLHLALTFRLLTQLASTALREPGSFGRHLTGNARLEMYSVSTSAERRGASRQRCRPAICGIWRIARDDRHGCVSGRRCRRNCRCCRRPRCCTVEVLHGGIVGPPSPPILRAVAAWLRLTRDAVVIAPSLTPQENLTGKPQRPYYRGPWRSDEVACHEPGAFQNGRSDRMLRIRSRHGERDEYQVERAPPPTSFHATVIR